jgi:secreted PhoX family phosphatase
MKSTLTSLIAALLSSGQLLAQGTCTAPEGHISRFTSVMPSTQPQDLRLPATHAFQMLAQTGDAYTTAADGALKGSFDFTAYVPTGTGTSSTSGYLSINHEGSSTATSGVSMLGLNFNPTTKLWEVTSKNPVNFGPVVGTFNNCSGGVTPWNTVVTCEENTPTGTGTSAPTDSNGDGYLDHGWTVELNPATHTVKDQDGNGTPDKLWRMGRFKHENVVVAADRRTVYEGADEGASLSFVYKYVATTPGQLANGTLYVLKLDGTIGTATTGTWIQVPNTTPAECNTTSTLAQALGATSFNGVEDVEINPVNSQIYFTAKGPGSTYRFTDVGTGVSGFGLFVGNTAAVGTGTPAILRTYPINYGAGTINEAWGTGNDNLTFDSNGNLYVLQDGGRNHVWVVRPCHTQANPAVEVFAVTPNGCEPTGMTFSPDERFMFISMQHPDDKNTLATVDAAGRSVVFNTSTALVIGLKGTLGTATGLATKGKVELTKADVYPNPVADAELSLKLTQAKRETATIEVFNSLGARVLEQSAVLNMGVNDVRISVAKLREGQYNVVIKTATTSTSRAFIKQ